MHQREELILEYLWLVKKIAKRVATRLGGEQEEFEADGMIGLIEAAQRYDSKKDSNFERFAYWRIRGSMIDGYRQQDTLGRHERNQRKRDPKRQDRTGHLIHSTRARRQEKILEELSKAGEQIAYLESRYMRELLDILPPRHKEMMEMHYLQQMTYEEIATKIKRSSSLVCLLHKKSIELIREYLKEQGLL